jgi:hypothetical protein
MFDDYWRACCRSQDSAGKRTVKTTYFWSSAILGKYLEIHISSVDRSSQKKRARWAARGPHHQVARASPRPHHPVVWPPWPTSASAPSRISSPRKPKNQEGIRDRLRLLYGAENTHREKALRQGGIYRGNSFPERGDRRHRHHHRAGLHRDHHHHHHHQHLHHHYHHAIPL